MATTRIMCLGDSQTLGTNWDFPTELNSYRKELHVALVAGGWDVAFVGSESDGDGTGWDEDHEGHGGYRTDQILAGLPAWLAANPPDVILLYIGINDILQSAVATLPAGWLSILQLIQTYDPTIKIFVTPLPPCPAYANDAVINASNVNLGIIVTAAQAGGCQVQLVHIGDTMLVADGVISGDGLHLSRAGYTEMAAGWYDALAAYLAPESSVNWADFHPPPRVHVAGSVRLLAGDVNMMAGSLYGTFDARSPEYHVELGNVGLLTVKDGWQRSAAQRLAPQLSIGGLTAEDKIDGQQVTLTSFKGGEGYFLHEPDTADRHRRLRGVDGYTLEGTLSLGPYMAAPAALQTAFNSITCMAAYRGYLVLGRSDGKVYTWDGTTLTLAGDTAVAGGVLSFGILETHLYIGTASAVVWRWQDAVHTVNFAANFTIGNSTSQTVIGCYALSQHIQEGVRQSFYGAEQTFWGLAGQIANTAGTTLDSAALKMLEPRCSVLLQYQGKLMAVGADATNKKWSLYEGDASNTIGWEHKALTEGGYVVCGTVLRSESGGEVLYLGDAVGGRIWAWDGSELKLAYQLASDLSPYTAQITGMAAWRGGLWISILDEDGTVALLRFDGNKSWSRPVTGLTGTTPGPVAVYADQLHLVSQATGATKVFRANGTFGSTGYAESGLIDGKLNGTPKIWDRAKVSHSALISGQSVTVAYKLNDTGSWTTLGTSSTVGATSAEFAFDPSGVTADTIAFKITLAGAAGSSSVLQVRAVVVGYRPAPGSKRRWQVTVDLMGVAREGAGARLRNLPDGTVDPRTGEEMSDQIWALHEANVPVAFLDRDRTRQYVVAITDYSEEDAPVPKLADTGLRDGWDMRGKLTLQEV